MVVTAAVVGNQFVGLLSESICVQLPAPEDPMLKEMDAALAYASEALLVPSFPTVLAEEFAFENRPALVPALAKVTTLEEPRV